MKKYGDVFLIKCTGQMYVHLPNLKTIREANITKADCFERRSTNFTLFSEAFGDGIGFANDEKWRVLRKFFSLKLKEYGMGRGFQEALIGDGLQKTVDALEKSKGQNFDAVDFFTNNSTEAICRMLFSGVSVDDDDLRSLSDNYMYMAEMMARTHVLLAGPLLKYVLMYIKPSFRKFRKCKSHMQSILRKIIWQHEKEFDKNNIRNLIDCYIDERKSLEQKRDPKSKVFSESSLVYSLLQFYGDGALSIGFFIAAVLKELASRPEVQKEIQRELDEVVGRNRFPSLDDKCRTPYTNAVIHEVIRTSDFLFAFPSLECTKETTIGGCRVPKGTITLVNFWASLRDPDVYKDPEKFDPTRFLQNESKKSKSELPLIFGIGKRSCTGEPLANMEIFLFVTTTLQNFDLHPAKEDPSAVPRDKNTLDMTMAFRATRRPH